MKVLLAKVLGAITPTTLMPSGLDETILSRDPEVIRAYRSDPLVHDRISFGFGKAGLDATDYAWNHAQEFSVPLLIMHGAADRNTYPHGSTDFAKLAARNNKDVTLQLWEGMYHEVHNEPEKEKVLQFMIDWLDRHV
jgi:alpha-beta hydrolase superfamily lysophospholipase